MERFDLGIIGGGAAGFSAAIRANEMKAKTALVNAGLPFGGTCVNVGCVPSKALIHAGEVLFQARYHGIPGIRFQRKTLNFLKVVQDELSLVQRLRQEKYEHVLASLEHVAAVEGKVAFLSPNEIEVNGQSFLADKIIIATGSTTAVPPIDNIKATGFITHIEALRLCERPDKLIIIGAGPLGLEFAQMYSRLGSQVTILELAPSIFAPGEKEVVERLRDLLTREGITVKTNATAKKASLKDGAKLVSYIVGNKEEETVGDEILLAGGKSPNTSGLRLDKAGVETDERQFVAVNEFLQTSRGHIFAAGDVVNLPQRLEATAGREGTLAAENALMGSRKGIDYHTVPYTIFTDPQLAGIGWTEEMEMKNLGTCLCRTLSFEHVPKAIIDRRVEGLIKMVVEPKTNKIMGVHILGPHAGELIAQAMVLMKNKNTVDDVAASLPMFPTYSEALKLVALSFERDISKLSCCI